MKKEEEIARLLSGGTPAAELVKQGFSRGTVYKVSRRLSQETTTPQQPISTPSDALDLANPELEADPEIMALKKSLRMAQLERQLVEIKGPPEVENRLETLEEQMKVLTKDFHHLTMAVKGSPLAGLFEKFICSCGAEGLVATSVVCTVCGQDRSYGWFPDES